MERFSNSILLASSVTAGLSGLYLLRAYLQDVKPEIYESMGYVILCALLYLLPRVSKHLYVWFGVIVAMAMSVLFGVSLEWHGGFANLDDTITMWFRMNLFMYSILTLYYESKCFGYASVFWLLNLLGFRAWSNSLSIYFGFAGRASVSVCTLYSFFVTMGGIALKQYPDVFPPGRFFADGMLWLGSFVFYTGNLIMASVFWSGAFDEGYWLQQMFIIAILVGALYYSNLRNLQAIRYMTNIYVGCYLMSKYGELAYEQNLTTHMVVIFLLSVFMALWVSDLKNRPKADQTHVC